MKYESHCLQGTPPDAKVPCPWVLPFTADLRVFWSPPITLETTEWLPLLFAFWRAGGHLARAAFSLISPRKSLQRMQCSDACKDRDHLCFYRCPADLPAQIRALILKEKGGISLWPPSPDFRGRDSDPDMQTGGFAHQMPNRYCWCKCPPPHQQIPLRNRDYLQWCFPLVVPLDKAAHICKKGRVLEQLFWDAVHGNPQCDLLNNPTPATFLNFPWAVQVTRIDLERCGLESQILPFIDIMTLNASRSLNSSTAKSDDGTYFEGLFQDWKSSCTCQCLHTALHARNSRNISLLHPFLLLPSWL